VPAARRASTAVLVRSASAAAVGVAAAGGLLVVLLALGRLPVGTERGLGGPLVVGVVAGAALTRPLARRAIRAVWAALQGTWSSPDELLAAFADGTAGTGTDVGDLLRSLAEALRREHRLVSVEIWSLPPGHEGDALHRTVTVPERPGPVPEPLDKAELALLARSGVAGRGWLRLWLPRLLDGRDPDTQLRLAPAVHGGRVLALLVAERAGDGDAVLGAEERALGEVATRLAVVLHNRLLDEALSVTLADLRRANADLQASRARLVSTADAERRRIERDLHDGAQQHLVALAVGLRLVRDGIRDGSGNGGASADVALLDELDRGVRESITALRDLAHGIYPPLLRDAGLPDALRAAAARSPLTVQVVEDGAVGRHPEPVEAAVYFCCLEALQNAAKHAPGSTVTLTLSHRDGALGVTVADDGPGFDAEAAGRGTGLQNMADRLGAVGGSVRWNSEPGAGTVVSASVPVASGPVAPGAVAARVPTGVRGA
ncbi:MAG: histidine kinase, partial [Pseudonocardiales bacterium]|nr:histidine kinase [Pseudonocardiales bacterium]